MKILIVCHDAAGAELVSSYVAQSPEHHYSFVLEGPATGIFDRKIGDIKNLSADILPELIDEQDCLITGTSQDSGLEKTAIRFAGNGAVKAITFLDYWYGYRRRFLINDTLHLPDEIWVFDTYALEMAEEEFPGTEIVLKPNPYVLDLLQEKNQIALDRDSGDALKILYLCQPYDENNLTDLDAIDHFLSIASRRISEKVEIRLRLHPLEKPPKYSSLFHKYDNIGQINEVATNTLAEDLAWADWAVGMHAQALAVALEFGLKVFQCIPDGGKPCVLPHQEILDFEEYVGSRTEAG